MTADGRLSRFHLGNLLIHGTGFDLQFSQVFFEFRNPFFPGLETAFEVVLMPTAAGSLFLRAVTGTPVAHILTHIHSPPFKLVYYYISIN
jgi:hypothetical protein